MTADPPSVRCGFEHWYDRSRPGLAEPISEDVGPAFEVGGLRWVVDVAYPFSGGVFLAKRDQCVSTLHPDRLVVLGFLGVVHVVDRLSEPAP
jgi:hypothetical protein